MDEQMMGMENNQFGDEISDFKYQVEIVLVMDATASMIPILKEVKDNALQFCELFTQKMEAERREVAALRIKVIAFRDFAYDGDKSMEESQFFTLPEEDEAFHSYVEQIQPLGGGDDPENALEALALAMRSDWTTEVVPGIKRRHVILLFTDADAAPLKDTSRPIRSKCARVENPTYPDNMPADLAELTDMWEGISQDMAGMPDGRAKRIVIFAPNASPWNDLSWNQSWINYSKASKGCEEIDIDQALTLLVSSIGD